jgi:hypothetical protein
MKKDDKPISIVIYRTDEGKLITKELFSFDEQKLVYNNQHPDVKDKRAIIVFNNELLSMKRKN